MFSMHKHLLKGVETRVSTANVIVSEIACLVVIIVLHKLIL